MASFESLSCCVCLPLVEAAAPTSIDRVPMAERNQAKVRLQTKAGISQWQDTRFFTTDLSVALQRFRTLLPTAPKDPTLCITRNRTARRRCIPAPAIAAPAPAPAVAAPPCPLMLRVDARLTLDLNNSTPLRNIHIHQQVLRCCLPPSEPLCRNGTTPTPAWTKPSRYIPTLPVNCTHRYALWSPSIDTMRFFLTYTLMAFSTLTLSCVFLLTNKSNLELYFLPFPRSLAPSSSFSLLL